MGRSYKQETPSGVKKQQRNLNHHSKFAAHPRCGCGLGENSRKDFAPWAHEPSQRIQKIEDEDENGDEDEVHGQGELSAALVSIADPRARVQRRTGQKKGEPLRLAPVN